MLMRYVVTVCIEPAHIASFKIIAGDKSLTLRLNAGNPLITLSVTDILGQLFCCSDVKVYVRFMRSGSPRDSLYVKCVGYSEDCCIPPASMDSQEA